jgi:hypothetical protein
MKWPQNLCLCLLVFLPTQVNAGEQLTLEALFQSADAVVLVDNPLVGSATVTDVLLGDQRLQNMSLQHSLCVPSEEILARWLETHPQHPARQLWGEVIDGRKMEQVVFLSSIEDRIEPFCETEVMLGLGFSRHKAYPTYRKEVDKMIAQRRLLQEVSGTNDSKLPSL